MTERGRSKGAIPQLDQVEKDGTGCVFGGIRGDRKGGREVGEVKDGFGEEETFEGVEGRLTGRGPIPGKVLLGEVEERAGDVGVVRDEALVEIGESKERVNIFHLGWGRPTCNSVEFNQVHG